MAAANSGSVGRGKPFAARVSKPTDLKPLITVRTIVLANDLANQKGKIVESVASATR